MNTFEGEKEIINEEKKKRIACVNRKADLKINVLGFAIHTGCKDFSCKTCGKDFSHNSHSCFFRTNS